MSDHMSKEGKNLLCEEFLSSQLTQSDFCKEKKLGLSTFHRWLRIYRIEKNIPQKRQFVPIKINTHSNDQQNIQSPKPFESIQIAFPEGIRINLPPYFNPYKRF
jgi:hypothetical protein